MSSRKQVVFRLVDTEGAPVDLTSETKNEGASSPSFDGQRPTSAGDTEFRLTAKTDLNGSEVFSVTGKICDGSTDMVEFELLPQHLSCAGVYTAGVGQVLRGETLVRVWPCYVIVEPNVFGVLNDAGPLTVPEIRLTLLDIETDELNGANLLDDLEFSDVQIAHAMRRVLDIWNETPPQIQRYTVQTFPYRYFWSIGTVSVLLDMAAARYRRNRLAYSAGGLTIDDQSKSAEYQEIAQAKKAEFQEWMMREKIRLNMDACWGTI